MTTKKSFLWSFFSSVKLAVVLLVLIVLVFIAATLLPPAAVQQFTEGSTTGAGQVFLLLRLYDLYHSPVFYLLMFMLSLNLIVCSLNRLPVIWSKYKEPPFPGPAGLFIAPGPDQMLAANLELNNVRQITAARLQKKYGRVREAARENEMLFYVERGRFSLYGVYVVHLSILIMIAGAVIGSLFGLEAEINIREGQTTDVVRLTKGGGTQKLNFSVRCDKFTVEFYENGMPKTYRSNLSFIKEGNVAQQGELLVNHPLAFEKYRFYQTSYGVAPEIRAVVAYKTEGQGSRALTLAAGDTFDLAADGAKGSVLRVEENIMQMGPAVKVRIVAPQKDVQFWIFAHIDEIIAMNPGLLKSVPMFDPGLFRPYVFSLERLEEAYYTGLHVARDPGVPLVALGGFFMVLGLLIVFFASHQRIWVRLRQEGTYVSISIAGQSNRNNQQLQKKLNDLYRLLREEIKA